MQTQLLAPIVVEAPPRRSRTCAKLALGGLLLVVATLADLVAVLGGHQAEPGESSPVLLAAAGAPVNSTAGGRPSRCLANPHRVDPIFGTEGPKDSHYCADEQGQMKWEPVAGCRLPPPQPFWLTAAGAICKGFGLGLLFWTKLNSVRTSWTEIKDLVVLGSVVSCGVLSIGAVVYKVWCVSAWPSTWWERHQCWGAGLSLAPWDANLLLYASKVVGASTAMQGYREEGSQAGEASHAAMRKAMVYLVIMAGGTLAALVGFGGEFLFTHLIPGIFAYAPFVALFGALGSIASACLIVAGGVSEGGPERQANTFPLVFIPLALTFGLTVQWLALSMAYLYDGMGWAEAAWMASSERQSSIYWTNFVSQVLGEAPWLLAIINEFAP